VAEANLTLTISNEVKEALAKAVDAGVLPAKKTKVVKAKKKPDVITNPAQPWSEPVQSVAQPVAVEKKQAQASIQITNADGTQTNVEEAVGKPKFFSEPHCTVSVGAKLKLQIVKYECHAEASIHLSVPCAATEIDDVADFAQNWVDKRMQDAAQKLEQAKQASS
jgi:hypothetical protein